MAANNDVAPLVEPGWASTNGDKNMLMTHPHRYDDPDSLGRQAWRGQDSAASPRSGDASTLSQRQPGLQLSATQRAVLTLSATGLLTGEIAAHLGMLPGEAHAHLATAIDALGARSKLEAVVLALRRGLIQLPDDAPADAASHSSARYKAVD